MRYTALIILTISLAMSALAQQQPTRGDLEKRRQGIVESIRQTEEQLEATKKDKTATMGQLRALQNKLRDRQRLIGTINEEIGQINDNIRSSSNEVENLKGNLANLRMRYAQSIRYAYKTRSSYDMLAFLFSSQDFNEALRRLKYLRKYRDYRKEQANKIRVAQGEIVEKINVLNTQRSQKDVLLTTEEQQKLVLQKETNETDLVVKDLKGREKELLKEIEKNRKAAKQLDRIVADIIRREMELARKKAEEEARKQAELARQKQEDDARKAAAMASTNTGKPATGSGIKVTGGATVNPPTRSTSTTTTAGTKPGTTTTANGTMANVPAAKPLERKVASYELGMTPEAAALSNNFESSRGRLPWPVEKGFISEAYGRHAHPIAQKVMIENNGIDIRTAPGAGVRAIYDGTVTKVFYIDGMDWIVMISHGAYTTLYSKLSTASVKAGQKVTTKQNIGVVGTDDDGQPVMTLQVWKGGTKQDPAGWIAR